MQATEILLPSSNLYIGNRWCIDKTLNHQIYQADAIRSRPKQNGTNKDRYKIYINLATKLLRVEEKHFLWAAQWMIELLNSKTNFI